jgi:hypothetical protein
VRIRASGGVVVESQCWRTDSVLAFRLLLLDTAALALKHIVTMCYKESWLTEFKFTSAQHRFK